MNPTRIDPEDEEYSAIRAEQIVQHGEYFPWNGDIWHKMDTPDGPFFLRIDRTGHTTSLGKNLTNLNDFHAPDNFYDTM